jgi:1,2-diacylglycerol 3-beta-galactosyltransferase
MLPLSHAQLHLRMMMQFQILYPGSTYELLDIMSETGPPPYNTLVDAYKHLSRNPQQWKLVYKVSNLETYEKLNDIYLTLWSERKIRTRIMEYDPDVVVSVHPLMTKVPVEACHRISRMTGTHLPMFTVVTDLGSGHCLWFSKDVEKVFIASKQIRHLAKSRGRVPSDKIVQLGLPIRHEFALQSQALGDRTSHRGKMYQQQVRQSLGLDPHKKTVLVMGGGEGVGSLSNMVNALYVELMEGGLDATIIVICGRNEPLQQQFATLNWDLVLLEHQTNALGFLQGVFHGALSGLMSSKGKGNTTKDADAGEGLRDNNNNNTNNNINNISSRRVEVVPLGFVEHIAEYMVAANVLISKAGPGTIAEAAALGLPVMLTSYLPGQEEGNVDFVINGRFGAYRSDHKPRDAATEVCRWFTCDKGGLGSCLDQMSKAATACGSPNAAREIAKVIGQSTLRWREVNDAHHVSMSMQAAEKKKKQLVEIFPTAHLQ